MWCCIAEDSERWSCYTFYQICEFSVHTMEMRDINACLYVEAWCDVWCRFVWQCRVCRRRRTIHHTNVLSVAMEWRGRPVSAALFHSTTSTRHCSVVHPHSIYSRRFLLELVRCRPFYFIGSVDLDLDLLLPIASDYWDSLPPLGLLWTMMLVWRKGNINRTVSVL